MKTLAMWAPNTDVGDWPPDRVVYVPMADILEPSYDELLPCDIAYATEKQAKTHFWFKMHGKHKVWVHEMTVADYIKMMEGDREANPFAAVNKWKFIALWKNRYGRVDVHRN